MPLIKSISIILFITTMLVLNLGIALCIGTFTSAYILSC